MSDQSKQTSAEATPKKRPIAHVKTRDGRIKMPIWDNESKEGKINYSTTPPERRYWDKKTEEYKWTTTIFEEDQLAVSKLHDQADDCIAELKEQDYQARKAANQTQSNDQQQAA